MTLSQSVDPTRGFQSEVAIRVSASTDVVERTVLWRRRSVWPMRSFLIASPDVLLVGANGILRITDDVHHRLSRLFRIEFHDDGLINTAFALREPVGVTDDISDRRRNRIVEIGMLGQGELRFRYTRMNVYDRMVGRDERHRGVIYQQSVRRLMATRVQAPAEVHPVHVTQEPPLVCHGVSDFNFKGTAPIQHLECVIPESLGTAELLTDERQKLNHTLIVMKKIKVSIRKRSQHW